MFLCSERLSEKLFASDSLPGFPIAVVVLGLPRIENVWISPPSTRDGIFVFKRPVFQNLRGMPWQTISGRLARRKIYSTKLITYHPEKG